jgi:hypothetical protein
LDQRICDLVEDLMLLINQVNEINYDIVFLKQLMPSGCPKQSVSTTSASSGPIMQKIKILEPTLFGGS